MKNAVQFAVVAAFLLPSQLAHAQSWRELNDDLLSFSFKAPTTSRVQRSDHERKRSYYSTDDARPVLSLDIDYLGSDQSWALPPKDMYKKMLEAEQEDSAVSISDVMEFTFRGYPAIRYKKSIGGAADHEYFLVRRGNQLFTLFTSDSTIADRFFDSLTFQ